MTPETIQHIIEVSGVVVGFLFGFWTGRNVPMTGEFTKGYAEGIRVAQGAREEARQRALQEPEPERVRRCPQCGEDMALYERNYVYANSCSHGPVTRMIGEPQPIPPPGPVTEPEVVISHGDAPRLTTWDRLRALRENRDDET